MSKYNNSSWLPNQDFDFVKVLSGGWWKLKSDIFVNNTLTIEPCV